jgi:hypothetical protein
VTFLAKSALLAVRGVATGIATILVLAARGT